MIGHRSLKKRGAPCPSCGGPVEFRYGGSLVTVCEFCSTAVGRGDRAVEDYGKISDLVETNSIVRLGSTGSFRGKPFECVGRVQYQHAAGGVWDEWYLRLPGDKIAWLAEAQGKLHLTFHRPVRKKNPIPDYESLDVGKKIFYSGEELTVVERGVATAKGAEGQIPWEYRPGDEHRYVDLVGEGGWFATFEFNDEHPKAYVGRTVEVADLNLSAPDWQADENQVVRQVDALRLNCPQCGGALELHAPDQTMRVGCPNCGSLLDAKQGKLKVFQTLKVREVHPVIPLGSTGLLRGKQFTLIGFMERFATYAGDVYPWTEYLLYHPEDGFRWLVRNDAHWSFVETVSLADVDVKHDRAIYEKQTYRIFDRGTAYVRYVIGEFYWEVKHGERVETADFICPPKMISYERSRAGETTEVNVSVGEYMTTDQIEEAFGLTGLLRPWGVGPIQPSPPVHFGVWVSWASFLMFLIIIHNTVPPAGTVSPDGWMLFYAMLFVSVVPLGILFWKHNFEVTRWKDSDYSPYASDDD